LVFAAPSAGRERVGATLRMASRRWDRHWPWYFSIILRARWMRDFSCRTSSSMTFRGALESTSSASGFVSRDIRFSGSVRIV